MFNEFNKALKFSGNFYPKFILAALLFLISLPSQAQTVPRHFTIEGRLFIDGSPVVDEVDVRFEVLNEAGTCVLFRETHPNVDVNSTDEGSKGMFSLPLGAAPTQEFIAVGKTFPEIFSNGATLTGDSCSFSPTSGESRKVRTSIKYSTASIFVALNPDTLITSVPSAFVAETSQSLQGKQAKDFFSNPGANDSAKAAHQGTLESLLAINPTDITTVISGGNSKYVSATTNGAQIPTFSANPSVGLQKGQMWFNTTDNKFYFYNGSASQELNSSDSNKVSRAGDTMTGILTMGNETRFGGFDLLNTGHITMAAQRALAFGRYTDGQQSTLITNLVSNSSPGGYTWYNSTSNELVYWDGAATQKIPKKDDLVSVTRITSGPGEYFSYMPAGVECDPNQTLKWNAVNDRWVCASDENSITSVFSRTGVVVATAGDYTASLITNTPAGNIAATTAQNAINELDSEKLSKAGDVMTGALTLNGQVHLRLGDSDSSHFASVRAPSTILANYVLTLPGDDGNSGQVLTTDGAGNLSWITPATGDMTAVNTNLGSGLLGGAASGPANLTIDTDNATLEVDGSTNKLRIKDGGVPNAKIANLAVTEQKISDSSVTSAKIVDATITDADISGTAAISWSKINTSTATLGVDKITSGSAYFSYMPGGTECGNGETLKWNSTTDRWNCGTDLNTNIITSVFGRTGAVVAAAGDYTASQVSSSAYGNVAATTVQAAIQELESEKVAKSGDTMTGALTVNGQFPVRFADSDSSNYISVRAPAAVTTDVTLTLPATAGTSGQVLSTNGSGVLSWVNQAGTSHSALSNLGNDDHSQYVMGAGRSTGQTVSGGISASENLTLNSTTNPTKGFVLLNSAGGSVGVGTTSPESTLSVYNDSAVLTLRDSVDTGGSGLMSHIKFRGGASTNLGFIGYSGSNLLYIDSGGASGGSIVFRPQGTEQMRLTTDGDLAIGTTTASEKLHVAGNILATGSISANSISTSGAFSPASISTGAITSSATITAKNVVTTTQTHASGTIDWSAGSTVTSSVDCSSAFAFSNMTAGGSYTLVVTSTNTTQCTFPTSINSTSVNYRFKPANAVRAASSHTVYTFIRVGNTIYVSWGTDF